MQGAFRRKNRNQLTRNKKNSGNRDCGVYCGRNIVNRFFVGKVNVLISTRDVGTVTLKGLAVGYSLEKVKTLELQIPKRCPFRS
jgi:hypothetical protein